MTDTITRIDYVAARKRLASITADPAVLAGFDKFRETGDFSDAYMRAVVERRISFDWLFLGKGAAHWEGCRDG